LAGVGSWLGQQIRLAVGNSLPMRRFGIAAETVLQRRDSGVASYAFWGRCNTAAMVSPLYTLQLSIPVVAALQRCYDAHLRGVTTLLRCPFEGRDNAVIMT
jgi:hypothetical protein